MSSARVLLKRLGFTLACAPAGCMLFNPLDPANSDGNGGHSAAGGSVSMEAGETSDGGRGGKSSGGASNAFGGRVSGGGSMTVEAGAAGEAGSAGSGGSAGSPVPTGSGGMDSNPPCAANADCYVATAPPAFCRPSDQLCVRLDSPRCRVTGDPTNPRALFFGAFAPFSDSDAANTVRDTYDLAFDEFAQLQGLSGPGGRHPLVMILCDSDGGPSVIDAGVSHLIDDVQVPAILAALSSADLQRNFEKGYSKTFYLSPQTVSLALAEDDVDGFVWNLLGRTSDLKGIYARVASQLESYRRTLYPSAGNLKVAVVTELANSETNALSVSVMPGLRFNGSSFTDNVSQGSGLLVDVSGDDAAQRVIDFKPDLVISLARDAFTLPQGFAVQIEQRVPEPRPHYLLSPWNSNAEADLDDLFKSEDEAGIRQAQRRFLGIDAASALDGGSRDVKNEYVSRLLSQHPKDRTDFENYYDAFYYLVYAMYAGGFPITSYSAARGMQRLWPGTEVRYVGPTDIFNNLTWLQGRDPMRLMGALGAPTFDVTGGRVDTGSVYCFDDLQPPTLRPSVIGYDTTTKTLFGTTPTLPCLTSFL